MKRKIVSDSGVNIRKLEGTVDYATVPLKIRTDEREFVDDMALDVQEMVTYLAGYKGKSGTACPSVADYVEAFGDAEEVFCFTITSNLSGSYNAARLAKEDYEAEHPERKVCIVDTLSAGPEMLILIERLQQLIIQEKNFDTICEELKAYQAHTGLMFSLESLKNLANNGRVNSMVAKFADVLGIRIVGFASAEGELDPKDKCRGEKKAIKQIAERMKESGYAGGKVRIDQCDNQPAAEQLKANLLAEFPEADIKIGNTYGLCSFYAEKGGLMIGYEK